MADINFYSGIDITGDINVSGSFKDTSGSAGSNGQVLSSTVTGTDWVDVTNLGNSNQLLSSTRSIYLSGAAAGPFYSLKIESSIVSGTDVVEFTNTKTIFHKDAHVYNEFKILSASGDLVAGFNSFGKIILGPLAIQSDDSSAGAIRFHEASTSGNSTYITLQAPTSLSATLAYTLPGTMATSGQILSSDTSGVMSWVDAAVDTNIANTNLTLDNNRILDIDGNSLEFDVNGGDIDFSDSAGAVGSYIKMEQGNLVLLGLEFPTSDGSNGQVLSTNGSGTLSFTTATASNIANTNLTLDAVRTLDLDGNSLTFENSSAATVIKFSDTNVQVAKELKLQSVDATTIPLRFHAGLSSSYSVSLQAPASLTSSTAYTLPDADGTNKQSLTTNGSAELSWLDAINIGNNNLTIPGTNTARTLTLSGGSSSSFAIETSSNDPYIHLEKSITNVYKQLRIKPDTARLGGVLQLWEGTAGGTDYIGLQPPSAVTTSVTYTLPEAPSTTGFVLSSTTAGVMSWVANGGTDTNIGTDNLTIDDTNRTLTLNSNGLSTFSILDTSGGTIAEFSDGSNRFVDPVNIKNVAGTVGSLYIFDQNNTNFIGFDVPFNTNSSILYTLPEPPTTNGQILASQIDGTMSWQDSATTPTVVMVGGGSVPFQNACDEEKCAMVFGGSNGFCSEGWGLSMDAATTTPPGITGLGNPGTDESQGDPIQVVYGLFKTSVEGEVRVTGVVKPPNSSHVEDEFCYIYVYEVPTAAANNMLTGADQSASVDYLLVASAKVTLGDVVSSEVYPSSFLSSNGTTVSKDSFLFATMTYTGDVGSVVPEYFKVNFTVTIG